MFRWRIAPSKSSAPCPELNERKGYVFPGPGEGQPLSNMALLMLLRRT